MRIVVTGGTGFIGSGLVARLKARKDAVRVMTRDPVKAAAELGQEIECVSPGADPKTLLGGVDAVVNLMGEPIFGKRWTAAQKERIRASRVDGTRKLVTAMQVLPPESRPKVFVSGSAVGYYGPRADQELGEDALAGQDFLAEVCREWEKAALEAEALGVRVVVIRTGIVLGSGGGALAPMMRVFKMGAGGPIGSGAHYMSWIHRSDEVAVIMHAIDTAGLKGPVNATAPNPCTNKAFARTLGKVLHRPAIVPTPPVALKVLFGESADILATGQRVVPRRLTESGFKFAHPELEPALRDVVANWY